MRRKQVLKLEELECRCLLSNAVFHTRSIVAADPATGQVGMAVVSFPTGVPAVVPVGEPGVIVANQSTPSYTTAQAIIAGIHQGDDAPTALANALAGDPTRESRQLGVAALSDKSPSGVTVATFTGQLASPARCGLVGDTYAVQANLQTSDQVCQAMADGFEKTQGSLAQRLLAAMAAGTPIGGDQRGEYSATLRVFSSRWEFASYTPIAVSANVDRSGDWFGDLKFGTDAYQAFWTRGDPADLVELTKDRATEIQGVLQGLGYYHGDVTGNWDTASENALVAFDSRNLAFIRRTMIIQGVRYIDGPLEDYMNAGYPRGVLLPAPGGAPIPNQGTSVILPIDFLATVKASLNMEKLIPGTFFLNDLYSKNLSNFDESSISQGLTSNRPENISFAETNVTDPNKFSRATQYHAMQNSPFLSEDEKSNLNLVDRFFDSFI
jgi:uncharacterized Ntn-hydrolase superfamily protein